MEEFRKFTETVEISNTGKIRKKGKESKPKCKNNFLSFSTDGREYSLGKAVLSLFKPVDFMDKRKVRRFDENPFNNNIDNLYWSNNFEKEMAIVRKTPLILKPDEVFIPIKELNNNYEISNYGNFRVKPGIENSHIIYNSGKNYKKISLINGEKRSVIISKLVLTYHRPDLEPKRFAIHLDGDINNNHVKNLTWSVQNKSHRSEILENLEGEIFKPLEIIDKDYEISNYGRIRVVATKRAIYIKEKFSGYQEVNFIKNKVNKSARIHRLVLMTFDPVENMENLYVNHINHNRADNRLENLEWSSPRENSYHRIIKRSNYTTDFVGINKSGRNKYRANVLIGTFNSLEEAEQALKEAYLKLGMENKYLDRRVSNPKRNKN
jgi:hypothetical protein